MIPERGNFGRSTLITVVVAVVLLLLLYQTLFDTGDPPDFTPEVRGNERAEVFVLPNPISAFALVERDEDKALAAITKYGSDRPEPAQLHLVSFDADGTLEIISTLDTPFGVLNPPTAIAASNGYLYVGLFGEDRTEPSLWVVELSADGALTSRDVLPLEAPIRDLAVLEDGPLLGAGFDGDFHLFELSNRARPQASATFDVSVSVAPDLAVTGSTVFVNHLAGIVLLDSEAEARPSEAGRIDHPDWQIPVAAPRSPGLLTDDERYEFDVPAGNFLDLATDCETLLIAASDLGLLMYDVSRSDEPRSLGSISSEGRVISVALDKGQAIIMSAYRGDDDGHRFLVSSVETESNSDVESTSQLVELVGTPRFNALVIFQEHVLVLFNDALITVPRHIDGSASSRSVK